MELKRKLNALAKRMSPQIEAMNVNHEIHQHVNRISELIDYAEQKIERSEQRKRDKEPTTGQVADDRNKANAKEQLDLQTAESDANLADQKESFDERNALMAKSEKPVEPDSTPDPAEPEP